MKNLTPGLELGARFVLLRRIAEGGHSQVWLAEDRELERRVALKVFDPSLFSAPGARARLQAEVDFAARLDPGQAVEVLGLHEADGLVLLEMAYLSGGDLGQFRGRSFAVFGRPLQDVAAALSAAHARGFVHRDLKCSNVLLDDAGRPRLADFGLSVLAGATAAGGSPYNMSPQQLRGEPASPADDLYEGCLDTGTHRSWYRGDGGRPARRMAELGRLSRSHDPEVRVAAATVLGRMGQASAGRRLVRMLSDRDIRVARSAAAALGDLGAAGVRAEVVRGIATHPDDRVADRLFASLATLPVRARAAALADLLSVERMLRVDLGDFQWQEPVRDRALEHLCRADRKGATARLIEAIRRPGVDAAAIDARLRDLTGVDPGGLAARHPAAPSTARGPSQQARP